MILCNKMKNGLCKVVTKSQVVTKFNATKSRLNCNLVFKVAENYELMTDPFVVLRMHG